MTTDKHCFSCAFERECDHEYGSLEYKQMLKEHILQARILVAAGVDTGQNTCDVTDARALEDLEDMLERCETEKLYAWHNSR